MFDLTANDPVPPFLRWAGGKRQLLSRMARYLPGDVRERRYIEPFAGAASMLLAVKPTTGILSDANELLMQCFGHIRDNPDLIADYLRGHLLSNSEEYYYQVRTRFNEAGDSIAQAARFIYLNKTCFNGIYRVNQRGAFNVPYGHKDPPALPSRRELRRASEVLNAVQLRSSPFANAVNDAREGDFVYLDPPYPPLNGTSYFTHYTANRFGWDDHTEVARTFRELSDRGCLLLMSNADLPRIRRLFTGYRRSVLDVTRYITCRTVKHIVQELIITNYDPEDV
jgi:DNA adenine methylase